MSDFPGFTPLKSNFTQTPNQFFDKVVGHYHPCVVSVIAILIRATLGWEDEDTGERLIEADLPLSAFVRPELSEQSARRGIAGAIEAGFIVQTQGAGPRRPARYALRWDDAEAQKRAIAKQRAAQRVGRKTTRRGASVAPLRKPRGATVAPLGGASVRGATLAPPIDNKETCSEKKERQQQTASSQEAQGTNSDVVVDDLLDEGVTETLSEPASPGESPQVGDPQSPLDDIHRRLVAEMVTIGMAEPVAEEYAVKWPEECRTQVDYYKYVDKSTVQTPGGFLRRAIDGKYGPPPGWHKHQAEHAEAKAARKRQEAFDRGQDAKKAAEKKTGDHEKAITELMLSRLSPEERVALDGAARARNKRKDNKPVSEITMAAGRHHLLLAQFNALPEDERQAIEQEVEQAITASLCANHDA